MQVSTSMVRKLLRDAIAKNEKHVGTCAKFVQLATTRLDGSPAVRTVVMRGFVAEQPQHLQLKFATDARSTKCQQLSNAPAVELCWYFSHTWEQFRLRGQMKVR